MIHYTNNMNLSVPWPARITGDAPFTLWIIPDTLLNAVLVCPSHNLAVILQHNPPEK